MLRIVDSAPAKIHHLFFDGYVPFSLYCRENFESLFWSGRHLNDAMIEVGLSLTSGVIGKVAVVSFQAYKRVKRSWQPKTDRIVSALPICDISEWGDCEDDFHARYRIELIEFEVVIGIDFASFVLLPESKVHTFYAVDRVLIGADRDGFICEFAVIGLSPEEVELVIPPSAIERTTEQV